VWVTPGVTLVGFVAGAAAFGFGALAYRVLGVARCRTIQRIGSALVAALITGLITAAALATTKSYGAVTTSLIAALWAAICAVIALRPWEKASG